MSRAKFCAQCGERLRIERRGYFLFPARCSRCSSSARRPRAALIVFAIACVLSGFIVGRYAGQRAPFYFIGTPTDLVASGVASSSATPAIAPKPGTAFAAKQPSSLDSPGSVCGAQTKSGRRCRRRVKNGGYCWQHRAKSVEKPGLPQAQ